MSDEEFRKKRVLVVGRSAEIMRRVVALLTGAGYEPIGHLEDAGALAALGDADVLVIGGGVEEPSRSRLRTAFRAARPGLPVIEHVGGPQGLLAHLAAALEGR